MAIQRFELELLDKKMISPNTMHLSFKRADNLELDYIAGQFVTFMFEPKSDEANSGNTVTAPFRFATVSFVTFGLKHKGDKLSCNII
jgi:NAD(P)H-flavin reductase